jgi:group II intron reverse transcriptase/maturase
MGTEGNMGDGVKRELSLSPARSETPSTHRSLMHGTWEIPLQSSAERLDLSGKATGNEPDGNRGGKSDDGVLPKKQPNAAQAAEAVEGRPSTKRNTVRAAAVRTQSRVAASSDLQRVREAARRDKKARFTALLHHITVQRLRESFYALKRDAAPGVDGVVWKEYLQELDSRLGALHTAVHRGSYRAQPVRRTYIPKTDGTERPLGVASLEDKIIQHAVVTVLNAIYESDFVGISYGFRPGRSQHDALDAVAVAIEKRKINWVVDADFRKFFDTIDPRWLRRFVAHRIGDQRLLRLIDKWLTAGVMEDGQVTQPERGTPQGSVISPLLANIYLHFVFDLWALQWRRRTVRGDMVMVRYADDTFLGFEHREEAERFLAELRERVAQFGLSLHPEKTRLIAFGRHANAWCRRQGQRRAQTFDFLGFTHICGITRGKGWFQLRRVTMAKRMHAKLAEIKQQLRRRLHGRMREVGAWLHKVLQGFYNYHAVPGNLRRLWSMRYRLLHAWWRILGRRSQLRMSWDRYFSRVRTWLPEPRVLHPYPDARFRATHSR